MASVNVSTRFRQGFVHADDRGSDTASQPGRLAAALKLAPILCVAVAVFILDLFIPKGVADGLLYVAPVAWIALWSNRHEASLVVLVATMCTVCAVAGFFLSPPGLLWLGLANRG